MSDRAQQIFEQTVDLTANSREKALDDACGDDTQLRRDVEELLVANDQAGNFMSQPTMDHIAAYSEAAEDAGSTIGRYKLLEKIGQGGFGDVFMAQQFEPVKRRVALKIIKLGMDTKQVVARFEAERQALALMDHPNIASVLDGGETKSGRPYFVMELVRGDPITEYCDREKVPTVERLKLFQQVCTAIQHAHQKGVIHRDIKPNNVLVTVADGKPLVKVIDFGIAKAMNTELTEKTLFTEFRQLIGTPQYMSPEQAERSGVDIDTRSDIYSLGVLLYEILTSRTPVDLKSMKTAVWEELQRMIREDEPTRPSMLVTSMGADSQLVAQQRGTDTAKLGKVLKGDLDWIVLKALEKDRTRRYGTATELSDDLERYMNDEAVSATPPSPVYKLTKLMRRNKAALSVAAAIFGSLLIGLLVALNMAQVADRARSEAMKQADQARQSEQAAVAASKESQKQRRRALRMAAMVASAAPEVDKDLVDAWLSDLKEEDERGELADEDILAQKCQLAVWWLSHGGGDEAANLIEDLYDDAKAKLGFKHPAMMSLANANIVAHINEYSPQKKAELFADLLEAAKHTQPEQYVSLYPQYASVLAMAGRDSDAVDAIDEYLKLRADNMPNAQAAGMEAMRLKANLGALAALEDDYPERLRQLRELETRLTQRGKSIFSVSASEQVWEGTLTIQGKALRLRFTIARSGNGQFSGTMTSLDQGEATVRISDMKVSETNVSIEFAKIGCRFVGGRSSDGTECVGKWTQAGKEYDLTIHRVDL